MRFFIIVLLVVLSFNQLRKTKPPKPVIKVDCKLTQMEIEDYIERANQQKE